MIFNDAGVQGADVSFWQDDNSTPQRIIFSDMVRQGASFVIIRAGQGEWADPDFSVNWIKAKEDGLPRGAYWYYDSRYDPVKQAELFASLVRNDPPELELWLDLEEHLGGPFGGYANWEKFLNRLRQLLPLTKVGIYTGYYYINGRIPSAEFTYFSQFPLWLAWYSDNPANVLIPKPWTTCLYWQWGTPSWGMAWGCESQEIDMNLFNGTKEDFNRRYTLSGDISVEHYYKVTATVASEYRTIRSHEYPNIKGGRIGQINAGAFGKCRVDDVYVYNANVADGIYQAHTGDRWLHITEANGVPIDGWVAEVHLGRRYLVVEEIGAPTPPSPSHVVEVYIDGVLEYRKEL